MIKSGYLGFLVFVSMMLIFFVLPDLNGLQKPFRILLGLSFFVTYLALFIRRSIDVKTVWSVIIGGILVLIMIYRGTIQASFINAYFCFTGLLCLPYLFFNVNGIRSTNLNYIYLLCLASILIQFLIFTSPDGRPTLAYQEINWSAAYLLLFFMFSDVLNHKYGKIFIIILALFTLSRLLIFSILLFYIVRYTKKYFNNRFPKIRISVIAIASYILISIFSVWYAVNVKSKVVYDTSINRVTNINDDSNKLRFIANTLVLATIYSSPLDQKVLLGFGPVRNFISSTAGSLIMPHNELLDAIVQFGLITVIFFAFHTLPVFNRVTSYENIEFVLPILFYTLILWVRFMLIPSFEMLFILFMLNMINNKKSSDKSDFQQNEYCLSGL